MTTAGQKTSTGSPASDVGTVLAQRYEVIRELGRGGMGVVYLCRDSVTGDRKLMVASVVLNWLVGPAVMFALAWLMLPDLPESIFFGG